MLLRYLLIFLFVLDSLFQASFYGRIKAGETITRDKKLSTYISTIIIDYVLIILIILDW